MVNTLNSAFLDNNKIEDIEIHYISESKEGQILEIYRYQENQEMYFLIKNDRKEIIRASLKYV